MKKLRLFKDTIHGITAYAMSASTAWMMIRVKCHKLGVEVPTMDKIILA